MKKFARLFELPEVDNQLLLTVDYDSDADEYALRMRTHIEAVSIALSLISKKRRPPNIEQLFIDQMESYTHDQALALYHKLTNVVGGTKGPTAEEIENAVEQTVTTGYKKRSGSITKKL